MQAKFYIGRIANKEIKVEKNATNGGALKLLDDSAVTQQIDRSIIEEDHNLLMRQNDRKS